MTQLILALVIGAIAWTDGVSVTLAPPATTGSIFADDAVVRLRITGVTADLDWLASVVRADDRRDRSGTLSGDAWIEIPIEGSGAFRLEFRVAGRLLLSRELKLQSVAERDRLPAALDRYGRLWRRGRPVFPHGYYSDGSLERLERLAAAGFNSVLDYGMTARPIAETRVYLDRAEQLGVMVIGCLNDVYPSATYRESLGEWRGNAAILAGVVEAFRDHPAVVSWYLNDEIDLGKKEEIRGYAETVRRLDPTRPFLLVHEIVEGLAVFADSTDIFGFDHYPVPQHGPADFARIYDRAVAAAPAGAPVWGVLQDFGWYQHKTPELPLLAGDLTTERSRIPSASEWRDGRPPTFEEKRAMLWLSIVHGSRGILWWCLYNADFLPDRAERWEGSRRLAGELSAVEPALSAPERGPAVFDDPRIHASFLGSGADRILVAVNDSPEPIRAAGPGGWMPGSTLEVLLEERRLVLGDGRLRDFFPPFGRHLYRAPEL